MNDIRSKSLNDYPRDVVIADRMIALENLTTTRIVANEIISNDNDIGESVSQLHTYTTNIDSQLQSHTSTPHLQIDDNSTSNLKAWSASKLSNYAEDVNENTSAIFLNSAAIDASWSTISSNQSIISTNTVNIASQNAIIGANTTDISDNLSFIQTNTAAVLTNSDDISINASNISQHTDSIAVINTSIQDIPDIYSNLTQNAISSSINASNISINSSMINNNATNVSKNSVDIDLVVSDIESNNSGIVDNTTLISTNSSNISANVTGISTNISDIATNTTNTSTNTSDIAANTTNISANTIDISSNAIGITNNALGIAYNTSQISTSALQIDNNATIIQTNSSSIALNNIKVSADQSINSHVDVDVTTIVPTVGDILKWDGVNWIPFRITTRVLKISNTEVVDVNSNTSGVAFSGFAFPGIINDFNTDLTVSNDSIMFGVSGRYRCSFSTYTTSTSKKTTVGYMWRINGVNQNVISTCSNFSGIFDIVSGDILQLWCFRLADVGDVTTPTGNSILLIEEMLR